MTATSGEKLGYDAQIKTTVMLVFDSVRKYVPMDKIATHEVNN